MQDMNNHSFSNSLKKLSLAKEWEQKLATYWTFMMKITILKSRLKKKNE